MGVHFDTSQVRRLTFDLSRAPVKAQRRASQAVRRTALDIEADAKILVPVDTGNLKGSISSDISTFHAEIGPTADYGIYVEEGTSRMAPQPYLAPAAARREPGFVRALQQLSEDVW